MNIYLLNIHIYIYTLNYKSFLENKVPVVYMTYYTY